MSLVIVSIILVFLAIQVLPVSIGIVVGKNLGKAILIILILAATQLATFWLGLKVGNLFMHLMDGFSGAIIFICFLLIGVRMLMEVFNIRKGERTYSIDSKGHIALASTAQGINSFLVGLVLYYIPTDEKYMLVFLLSATVVVSILGIIMKPQKITLAFASLLYTLGGLTMLFSSVYFSFFYN